MPHGAAKRLFLEKGDGYRDSPLPASNSSDLWGALSSLRAVRDHKAAGAVAGSAAPVCGAAQATTSVPLEPWLQHRTGHAGTCAPRR